MRFARSSLASSLAAASARAQEQEAHEPVNLLSPNYGLMFWTLIIFVVLLLHPREVRVQADHRGGRGARAGARGGDRRRQARPRGGSELLAEQTRRARRRRAAKRRAHRGRPRDRREAAQRAARADEAEQHDMLDARPAEIENENRTRHRRAASRGGRSRARRRGKVIERNLDEARTASSSRASSPP